MVHLLAQKGAYSDLAGSNIGLLNFGLAQKWLAIKNLDYQIQIFQEGYFEL